MSGMVVPALVASCLGLSACGSRTASPPVAHVGTPSTTSAPSHQAIFLAARCLRRNGLTNLPDPSILLTGPAKGEEALDKRAFLDYPQSVVSHAMAACATELARAGMSGRSSSGPDPQQLRDLLAFARCVRRHGISNFPDPNNQGGFDLAGTGINSHDLSSAQLAAARACLSTAHGNIHIPAQGTGTTVSGS